MSALRRAVPAVVLCAAVILLSPGAASAATSGAAPVPYSDPNSVGYIGLCNSAGQQITSGSTTTTPFVLHAVSSRAAVAPYNGKGRTASLYGFQPRQQLPPAAWSGEEMTAAGRYSNPAHPMTAATGRDDSLADLLADYPLSWDNLVQLRIYLGAPNEPIRSGSYPSVTLKVTGSTWKVVGPSGKVNCAAGTSTSVETLLLPKSELTAPASTTPSHHAASSSAAAPAGGGSSASGSSPNLAATSATPKSHGGVGVVELLTIFVVAAALAGSVGFGIRRHRDKTFVSRYFARSHPDGTQS